MTTNPLTRTMYHATHLENATAIMTYGLEPKFSQGKRKAVWFTSKNYIQVAILHAAARHNWHINDMVVIVIEAVTENIRYSGIGNFMYSSYTEHAETYSYASLFLDENQDGKS